MFGARISPTDATTYEFNEITHASKLNEGESINYLNYKLKIVSIQQNVGLDTSRSDEGKILTNVKAKILSH